jgi:DNA-directed RNA polymerase subunit RPC12/RpoP
METIVTYKCPNCDAGLLFDAEEQLFKCEFCLSKFTENELNSTDSAKKAEEKAKETEEYRSEILEYRCSSCGAEVIAEKNTAADFCYYCHNPIVLTDKVSGEFKPTKIIPFKFDKEEAKASFLRFAKKKWFVPKDYFSGDNIEKIAGVYYPFWVTDADTDSEIHAIGKNVRSWRSGDYRYTETTTYAVQRRGEIHFEDITTSAISTEDKKMLEGILPYPVEDYQDFSMPYLQGYVAKKRDIDRDSLSGEVKAKMNSYAETLLSRTTNYDSLSVNHIDVAILSSHWEYSLMPIWILTYKKKHKKTPKKDKTYVYAMNGSTGKVFGELPVSIPKLLLAALGTFIGSGFIGALIGYLLLCG